MVVFQDNGCQCLGEWSPSYIFPGHPPMPEGGHCLTDTNIQDTYTNTNTIKMVYSKEKYTDTNTKSVNTHCMKEEAFWVVGEGRKGGFDTCLLSKCLSSINRVVTTFH